MQSPRRGRAGSLKPFDCFVVGDDLLTLKCCEILLSRGHNLHGIVTADAGVADWAADHGIRHCPYATEDGSSDEALALLSSADCDYLFSIVNEQILRREVLRIPRRYVINYHNGPLPRYAGLEAASWALIYGEQAYGITWHVVREEVDTGEKLKQALFPHLRRFQIRADTIDTGEILKQSFFQVDPDETVLSLNIKCGVGALDTFPELIDELAAGSVVMTPQDLSARTYFGASKRPAAACSLLWEHSAQQIDNLVRALDFGPIVNHLGRPKFGFGDTFFWVSGLEILDKASEAPPGTVRGIDNEGLTVATTDYDVCLQGIHTLDGWPLPANALAEAYGLGVNERLEILTQAQAEPITRYDSLVSRHELYWLKRLEALTPLAAGYARQEKDRSPALQPAAIPLQLPESTVRYLAEQASSWSVDQFLVTAFLALMARINGSYEFDVGFRHLALRRELAGWGMEALFASHVPLHVTLKDQASLAEAFAEVREQIAATIKHKTYARDMVTRFPGLRELYAGERSLRFPVVVDWVENRHDIEQYKAPLGSELALVTLPDEALEAGEPCAWLYSELLDAENVKGIAGHFMALLEGMASEPSTPICQLPLMTEAERHRLLVEWNDTEADFPRDQCFHELFELQVKRTPEAIAVVDNGRELTYRALNKRANQLAHYLQALGVGPEVLVGICMERSLELVVGIMGILKAGGAYLPLDPASPEERLAFMLEDAQASIVLSQKELAAGLLDTGAKVLCLDTDWPDIAQNSRENPHSHATAENLAYVLYTSGSTGRPKGVMIQHRSMLNLATALQKAIYASHPGAPFRLSLNAPIFFDASVQRLVMLLYGHTFYIIPQEVRQDGEALLAFVRRNRLDGIDCVPSQLKILLAAGLLDESEWMPSMVLLGGEAIDETTWQTLSTATGTQFFNMYGPTECTVDSTIALVGMNAGGPKIGGPVANARAYVLDKRLQPVPVAVPGELHIGGAGVGRGYLRRPQLTAERFIPDPFSNQPGSRLYKTGDLVWFLPDGTIKFLGRIDHQVKVRGFRIELGEIEAALSQHPAVRETVTLVREDLPGDKRLVAYVAPEGQPPTATELRHFLQQKLPEYMVPSAFVMLDALPMTPNGKVDRHGLPAPDWARPASEQAFVGPRSAVEEVLTGTWTEALGVERVGVHDNFFELGGDSLLATQMISRLRARFQVDLSVRTLFERPTVAGLAEAIEQASEMGRSAIRPRILPAARRAERAAGLSATSPRVPASEDRKP